MTAYQIIILALACAYSLSYLVSGNDEGLNGVKFMWSLILWIWFAQIYPTEEAKEEPKTTIELKENPFLFNQNNDTFEYQNSPSL